MNRCHHGQPAASAVLGAPAGTAQVYPPAFTTFLCYNRCGDRNRECDAIKKSLSQSCTACADKGHTTATTCRPNRAMRMFADIVQWINAKCTHRVSIYRRDPSRSLQVLLSFLLKTIYAHMIKGTHLYIRIADGHLRAKVLYWSHEYRTAGHPGKEKTLELAA